MGRFKHLTAVACMTSCLALHTTAAVAAPKSDAAAEEAALRQVSQEYLAALDRGDWKAVSDYWVPTGVYVDEQGVSHPIKDMLAGGITKTPSLRPQIKLTATKFRFLTADAAVEDGTSEIVHPGQASAVKGRFSAVWVRSGGKWRLDSLRESRASDESQADALTALEPLVGEWAGQSGGLTMHVQAGWNAAKTSLRRDITLTSDGKTLVSAVQQIGWDPRHQQIRSTTLNDNGSCTDGIWSQEGNIWMVLARATHPNGTESRSTQIFKFADRNTILWKSIHVTIGDRPSADFLIRLTRGKTPAVGTPAPQPPAPSPADEAEKAKLLAGETWKNVEAEFQKWAAIQVLYTPRQFEQMKARLIAQIKQMTAPELKKFITELDSRLKLLLSKDAVEAQAWLGQYLSVLADPYREKFVGQVPDFFNMTSAQIEEEFLRLKSKILSQQQAQAQFEIANAQAVKTTESQLAAARQAEARDTNLLNAGPSSGGYQSHYSPKPKQSNHDYHPPQMNFYEWGGRIGYSLPL